MSLPDLIEIEPLAAPAAAAITVPGSKSITNRALVLAALGGQTTLTGALWSDDTRVMVDCLVRLGFAVKVEPDAAESANRTITVTGLGGRIPRAGTESEPLVLFVGNAGTAARFLATFVCLGHGVYRLEGVPRMHERPQAELFASLRELGYRVDSPNDRLPATIHGTGPRAAGCGVSMAGSSQFASALLLSAGTGGWQVRFAGTGDAEEAPYVAMTQRLVEAFPRDGGQFHVEPDASSGSYFWGADWLLGRGHGPERPRVRVNHWPDSGWQVDGRFPGFLPLPPVVSRERDLGDSIMTGIVLAPFGQEPVEFTDLGRLRVQECERVAALRTELGKCGARIEERGDTLRVWPGALHGAEIETYDDHRMAMCFATLGLQVSGLKIRNPSCVKKTFPNFFQKLSAPGPAGLGACIRDARTGRVLAGDRLLAP
ncbi:MAG: hypothetical protein DVB31_05360 [Verrucomicrobia bacterium]|nr:MAG: hypothetical protein DVB31_05360 [Verrucomicrobiota bacterium]